MHIDDLRAIFLFDGLSDEQLLELIAVGDEVHFDKGDVLFREGDAADFWWVLLDGRIELLRRSGQEESVVRVMDRPGVWAGGFRAWADTAGYLATGCGAQPGTDPSRPIRGTRGTGARLVSIRRSPDSRRLPDGAHHGSPVAPA